MNHNNSADSSKYSELKSDLLKTVASNVKKFRTECGFTQEQLAEKTSLSIETIGNLENAKSWFSLDSIIKISSALKVKPYQLLLDSAKDEVVPVDLVSAYMGGFADFVKSGAAISYSVKNSKRKGK